MDVLAEVTRSGLVESRHRGVAALVGPDGEVAWSIGDVSTVIFPRSANKPFQAVGMLRCGLGLDGSALALVAASHSAEPFHLEGVRAILAAAGLQESALQTPSSYPLDPHEHAAVLRAGQGRAPIRMDCSGKHAAMLLTCVRNGWDTATYLRPDHPLQEAVTSTFAELVGAPAVVGVDGCGAPLLASTVGGLAAGVARLMAAPGGSSEQAVVQAMVDHPEQVSGTRRPDLALARAVPGALVKSGAESVVVVGLPDGRALAVKVEDGSDRALFVVAHRALELAGIEAPLLSDRPEVLGGGRPVGEIRPAF
ncbi:asparaginase [Aeromicrobium sp. CTD01-1L150]|uniref:asparaginase n=1 Tax=Aeromicrobium sp. CTD01-1L150 TaxID=3341830 RepID=UPI0035BFF8D6